jgi:hypothetical protein
MTNQQIIEQLQEQEKAGNLAPALSLSDDEITERRFSIERVNGRQCLREDRITTYSDDDISVAYPRHWLI